MTDALTKEFEAQRPRLVRVAYTTIGSMAEAEDCVQEAWLRLRGVEDPAAIRAWLARGLVLRDADGMLSVISFTVDGGRITAIDVIRNPDKLGGVREPD
jgi:Sigma-70 region 2